MMAPMTNTKEAARTVRFWSPFTATWDSADYRVEIKAPEEGNTATYARNQTVARLRSGTNVVYDRGTNYNTLMDLQFKDISDTDRAQLVIYLEAIQWASVKSVYQDMYGDQYVVRVLGEKNSAIKYIDRGTNLKRGPSFIRWDFNLELLNLTDNDAELTLPDGPVTSNALTLHLLDHDEPHDPEVKKTINIADGTVVIDSFNTNTWKTIIWKILIWKGTKKTCFLLSATTDRDYTTPTDATDVTTQSITLVALGDGLSRVTFTVDLTGSGLVQLIRLKVATTEDGWNINLRRSKMGGA